MGEKEVLMEVVEKAREELKKAQDVADNTRRPENACAAHDCQFALTKALSHGIDVLLMLKLEEMRDNQDARQEDQEQDPLPTKQKIGARIAEALTVFDYGTSAYRSVILSNGVFIAQ